MKKIKSILCGALAFIAGSVVLSACGAKTEPQTDPTEQTAVVGTKTIISLAEAKKLIVSALAIDNNQLQTQSTRGMVLHAADVSEGNRDIFEKMGNFTFDERDYVNEVSDAMNEDGLHHVTGQAIYHNHQFETIFEKYFDAEYCYGENYCTDGEKFGLNRGDDGSCNVEYQNGYGGIADQFILYRSLFEDEAFDRVYDDKVAKEINENGYSITLQGNYKNWYYYGWSLSGTSIEEIDNQWDRERGNLQDCPQEYLDKCHFNVTINFDSNYEIIDAVINIQDIFYDINNLELDRFVMLTSLITVTKTNTELKEPEWVTEYRNPHN